jgi:hypothetical protein
MELGCTTLPAFECVFTNLELSEPHTLGIFTKAFPSTWEMGVGLGNSKLLFMVG